MAENIAEASVRIVPDFSTFDAQVLAHAQAAAKTIEASLAKVKLSGLSGTAGSGLNAVTTAAAPATQSIDALNKSIVGLDKSVLTLNESFKKTKTETQGVRDNVGQVGRALIPLTLAFSALAVKAVTASSAIVEAVNAVNVAFGESSGEVQAFARNLQTTDTFFGLTERAALDAAATFGLFLNDIVKSKPVLAGLSEQLITTAAHVGSLFNVQTNKVIQDFQSGLAGQTRAVRKYGLDISEAATKQEALRLGLVDTGEELGEEEKRLSRLSLLLHGSAVAAGDAELTQNTFAGALRTTQVALGGAIDQIGKQLIPLAKSATQAVGFLADGFGNLSGFTQRLSLAVFAIGAALGPALLVFSKLKPIILGLIPAIQSLTTALVTGEVAMSAFLPLLAIAAAGVLALKFAFDAPSASDKFSSDLQDLARLSAELNNSLSPTPELLQQVQEKLDKLGLTEVPKNFEAIEQAAIKARKALEEAANAPPPVGLQTRVPAPIRAVGELIFGSDDPQGTKEVTRLKNIADAELFLRTAIQAKDLTAAQEFITNTKNVEVQKTLQGVFDTEIKLQVERELKVRAANKAYDTLIQQAIDARDPTERLNKLFAESVENLNNLLQAQTSVTSAEKSIRSSKTSLGNAQDRLNKLLQQGKVDLDKVKQADDALIDATNKRIAADQELVDLRKELVELEKPATADELTEATDKITAAEIRLAQATRAREAAEKALEPRAKARLNLAGLTLDQLREVLANERATLKATREQKKEEGATAAETATLATIAERDAARDLTDAQQELTEVQKKGTSEDQNVIDKREELARATTASAKAAREELDARKKLEEVKAGDPDFERKVAEARQAIADATDNLRDAEQRLREAQIKRGEQELVLAGNVNAGNIALAARLALNKDLLQQEKNNEIFLQQFETLLANSGLFPHPRGPGGNNVKFPTIHEIALSLINDPNSPFREVFKILNLPPFAEGAVLDRPTIGIFGEAGREGVIPFTKPKRAATLLVGAREFPAIEAEIAKIRTTSDLAKPTRRGPRDFGGLTLDRPTDSEAIGVLRSILERLEMAAGVKIDVHPTPGMSESQLARKVAREMGRYWGTP